MGFRLFDADNAGVSAALAAGISWLCPSVGEEEIVDVGTKLHLGSGEFINCPECQKLVDHVHSIQQDRLYLSRKLQAIRKICTTESESKTQFIARILSILDGA